MAEPTGYGVSGYSYLCALNASQLDVSWFPLTWRQGEAASRYRPMSDDAWLRRLDPLVAPGFDPGCIGGRGRKHDAVLVHTIPEYWPHLVEDAHQNLGYTVWETSRLPAHWDTLLGTVDKVIVPSRFAEAVVNAGNHRTPVFTVPHLPSVHTELGLSSGRFLERILPRDVFVFYTINVWQPRKALDVLVHAYMSAFSAADPVVLYLKTGPAGHDYSGAAAKQTRELISAVSTRHRRPPRVITDTACRAGGEIVALHQRGDCYVSLTRGEGWGMAAFEAAWLKTPVIITGYGGQTDFLDPELCHLVDFTLVPVRPHPAFSSYTEDQRWADPSLDAAVEAMRRVFSERSAARRNAERLSRRVKRDFARQVTTRKLIDTIRA